MQSLANMGTSSPSRVRNSEREDSVSQRYLDEYDIERRSVYVGNLPTDAVRADLLGLFEQFGTIIDAHIHKNESLVDSKFLPSARLQSSLTRHSHHPAMLWLC